MSKDGGWRYQAVYTSHDNDVGGNFFAFSICEVYLDKEGKLEFWTENPKMEPSGETYDELIYTLEMMMNDVRKWKPVLFDKMQVCMTFERIY